MGEDESRASGNSGGERAPEPRKRLVGQEDRGGPAAAERVGGLEDREPQPPRAPRGGAGTARADDDLETAGAQVVGLSRVPFFLRATSLMLFHLG